MPGWQAERDAPVIGPDGKSRPGPLLSEEYKINRLIATAGVRDGALSVLRELGHEE